jgi:hypothetical protein
VEYFFPYILALLYGTALQFFNKTAMRIVDQNVTDSLNVRSLVEEIFLEKKVFDEEGIPADSGLVIVLTYRGTETEHEINVMLGKLIEHGPVQFITNLFVENFQVEGANP